MNMEAGQMELYAIRLPDGRYGTKNPYSRGVCVLWTDNDVHFSAVAHPSEMEALTVATEYDREAQRLGVVGYTTKVVKLSVNVTIVADNGVPVAVEVEDQQTAVWGTPVAKRGFSEGEIDLTMVQGDPDGEMIQFVRGALHPDDVEKYKAALARAAQNTEDEDGPDYAGVQG